MQFENFIRSTDAKRRRGIVCFVERCFGANHTFSPMVGEGGTECPLPHSCSFAVNGSPVGVCNDFVILTPSSRPQLTRAGEREGARKRIAFTLAEVLITLGIIGVVAAITIPNLVSKYNKHVIETGIKKTYSDLYEAIKRSEADNGEHTTWDYKIVKTSQTNFIDTYFKPYLNLQPCNGACWNGGTWQRRPCWKAISGKVEDNVYCIIGNHYVLPDGRSITMYIWHADRLGTNDGFWKVVYFWVDVDGERGKSIIGRDVFQFSLFSYPAGGQYGLYPGHLASGQGEKSLSDNAVRTQCLSNGSSCSVMLYRNNWKFPKDYPIKF